MENKEMPRHSIENVSQVDQQECFVMMPFNEPAGYQKDHFMRVFNYLIKPACLKAGYKAKRVDENAKAGIIMLDILDLIVGCDIAICDMSSRNPNVFYELGLRQAFDKKCVLIKDDKTDYPFDVNMLRTIEYDSNLRIDLIQDKVDELANAIKETVENTKADGSSLVQLLSIKKPAKINELEEMDNSMAILLNAIQSISSKIDGFKKPIDSRMMRTPIVLPNKEKVYIGDKLYKKVEDFFNDEYGTIVAFTESEIIIKGINGILTSLPLSDSSIWEGLTKDEI